MNHSKIKAVVNDGQFQYDSIDLSDFDVVEIREGYFHLLKDQQAYTAQVVAQDFNSKIFTIKINGHLFQVKLLDEYDQMVNSLGLTKVQANKINEIKAPMPGVILDILVEEGDVIEPGMHLLILEAMKMENVIKAHGKAVVKSITTQKGAAVDKGEILIEME